MSETKQAYDFRWINYISTARKSKITYLFNTATVTYIVNDITVFKSTNKV